MYERAATWLAARSPDAPTIAVTHEMLSRALQGAYAGYEPERMLALSHPHGRVLRFAEGRVTEGAG